MTRDHSRSSSPRRPARRLLRAIAPVLLATPAFAGTAAPASASAPAGAPEVSTTAVWPLQPQPEVVHVFAPPDAPWAAGHRGVDLLGRLGQSVRAALDGRVSFAGTIAGVGIVVVDHGSTRTTYQPIGARVAVGDAVDAGQVLGRLAWFGSHCLPLACVHWGLLAGDEYLDPLALVGGGPQPVRLLPLQGAASPLRASPAVVPSRPTFWHLAWEAVW